MPAYRPRRVRARRGPHAELRRRAVRARQLLEVRPVPPLHELEPVLQRRVLRAQVVELQEHAPRLRRRAGVIERVRVVLAVRIGNHVLCRALVQHQVIAHVHQARHHAEDADRIS